RLIDEYLFQSPYKLSTNERNDLIKSLNKIKSLLDDENLLTNDDTSSSISSSSSSISSSTSSSSSSSSSLSSSTDNNIKKILKDINNNYTNYILIYEFKDIKLLDSLNIIIKEQYKYLLNNKKLLLKNENINIIHSQIVQRPKLLNINNENNNEN